MKRLYYWQVDPKNLSLVVSSRPLWAQPVHQEGRPYNATYVFESDTAIPFATLPSTACQLNRCLGG
jgi:hypothetical protein